MPDDLVDKPVLSDAQIDRIAKLAETAERLFSGPQDIEGVVTADSAIHLVQVRPAVRPRTVSPSVEWTNHNLTESFPGVTTAMTYSHARTFYRMSFHDFYRTVGVPDSQLRSREHQLRRMVGYLDGRLYYRLDAWYALHSQIPGWDVLRPLWERSLGLQAHNTLPRLTLDRRAIAGLLARSPRLIWAAARFPRQLRNFLAWWDDQHVAGMELSQLPAEDIVAVYRRVWSEAERHWGVHDFGRVSRPCRLCRGDIARPALDGDRRGQPRCAVARRNAEPDVGVGALHGGACRADQRHPRTVAASADRRRR